MHTIADAPHETTPGRKSHAPRSGPSVLTEYEDLAAAARRLDELAEAWDASAVVAAWTQPGDPHVNAVATARASSCIGTSLLGRAASGLLDSHRCHVRWRELFVHDNLLRAEKVSAVSEDARPSDLAVEFVTPRGGRGRFVVIDGDVETAALQMEAMLFALRLPAALARERAHEDLLRATLSGVRGGALVIGSEDDLRFANVPARRSLGLDEHDWDMPSSDLVGGRLSDLVAAARQSHGPVGGEFEGSRGLLSAEIGALTAEPDGPLLVQLHDLTERRRVERQQNEFVGTIGHELKTPLTSARTALELVTAEETGPLNEEQHGMLARVVRNLERLEHLVHQLLDTARLRVGRLVLQRETRALADLLDPVLESALRAAQNAGRDFCAGLDPRAVAYVDVVRFGEIVENLVGNAVKFTPVGGHVGVRVRAEMACPFLEATPIAHELGIATAGCEVEVCDDGPGMDATTREHAFEAFYQDGDPLADRPSGAGLGLSIVRSLVQAHDGHVELHTEPGCGTCVRVWVPSSRALARAIGGVEALRQKTAELLRTEAEVLLELAPTSPTAEADLAGLDRVDGSEVLLVRVGDAHLARLSPGGGRGAPLPGARRARLGKDAPRIGTALARLARELRPVPVWQAEDSVRQEEPRA